MDSILLLSLPDICLSFFSSSCPLAHLKQEALSMVVVGRKEEEEDAEDAPASIELRA